MNHHRAIALLFILAVGIYSSRLLYHRHSLNHRPFMRIADKKTAVNPRVFKNTVISPNEELFSRSFFSFIVFLDPNFPCTSFYDEIPHWKKLVVDRDSTEIDLYLIIPKETARAVVETFANQLAISEDNILFFERGTLMAEYARAGLLKTVYSQEHGVLVSEMGQRLSHFDEFSNIVRSRLATL